MNPHILTNTGQLILKRCEKELFQCTSFVAMWELRQLVEPLMPDVCAYFAHFVRVAQTLSTESMQPQTISFSCLTTDRSIGCGWLRPTWDGVLYRDRSSACSYKRGHIPILFLIDPSVVALLSPTAFRAIVDICNSCSPLDVGVRHRFLTTLATRPLLFFPLTL